MATLMYKIANEEHPEIRVLRPELPACIGPIIDKMLQKDVEQRYQTGAEVINDIKRCLIMIKKSANK
jgi:serine/threonine-protein kinase